MAGSECSLRGVRCGLAHDPHPRSVPHVSSLSILAPVAAPAAEGRPTITYLQSQRRNIVEKGSARGKPRERELSPKHGYDTKYAMHALRIGYQGLELLETGPSRCRSLSPSAAT